MLKVCRRLTPVAAVVLAMASPSAQRDDTHGRDAVPDYEKVFNQDSVGRLEIRMAASDWEAVVADMDSMAGRLGGAGGFGMPQPGPGGGGQFPAASTEAIAACGGRTEGDACSFGTPAVSGRCVQTGNASPLTCVGLPAGGGPGGTPGGGANPGGGFGGNNGQRDDVELLPRTPIYVPVDLTFDGETFRHVGFRLKGNSSLVSTWQRGAEKVPFRLNIDALEERYPEIVNQTFFGFQNLGFSNNILDSSYLRAKVVTDLMRESGLPAPRTAFMRVYLDRGAGLTYLGLYTMIEIPDEPMLDTAFGSSAGNLYKPHGTGGRWTVFDQPTTFPSERMTPTGLDRRRGCDCGAERPNERSRGLEAPARGAIRRRSVPAVAGAQHPGWEQRRVRRPLGAQLLSLRKPAASGPAVLDPVGSRPRHPLSDRGFGGRWSGGGRRGRTNGGTRPVSHAHWR